MLVRGDDSVLALAGRTYVDQSLQNLIANAITYSAPESPVEVVVAAENGMAVVRVLDRGKGVDSSERVRIFQPFYRSEQTASFAEGLGIGLSLGKRLIEALGGSIWSFEREGAGRSLGSRYRWLEMTQGPRWKSMSPYNVNTLQTAQPPRLRPARRR